MGYRKLHEKLKTEENFKEISLKKVPQVLEGWKAGWKDGTEQNGVVQIMGAEYSDKDEKRR